MGVLGGGTRAPPGGWVGDLRSSRFRKLGPLSHLDHEHFLQQFRIIAHGTAAQEAEVETVITSDISNPDAHRVMLETIEVD